MRDRGAMQESVPIGACVFLGVCNALFVVDFPRASFRYLAQLWWMLTQLHNRDFVPCKITPQFLLMLFLLIDLKKQSHKFETKIRTSAGH